MRKLLLICGVVFGLGALALTYVIRETIAVNSEGIAYVDAAFPAIASDWSPHELKVRATSHLLEMTSSEEINKLFGIYQQGLGSLISFRSASGVVATVVAPGHGSRTTGRYAIIARFAKGPAEVDFLIVKMNRSWMIDGFQVKSTKLLENLAGQAI